MKKKKTHGIIVSGGRDDFYIVPQFKQVYVVFGWVNNEWQLFRVSNNTKPRTKRILRTWIKNHVDPRIQTKIDKVRTLKDDRRKVYGTEEEIQIEVKEQRGDKIEWKRKFIGLGRLSRDEFRDEAEWGNPEQWKEFLNGLFERLGEIPHNPADSYFRRVIREEYERRKHEIPFDSPEEAFRNGALFGPRTEADTPGSGIRKTYGPWGSGKDTTNLGRGDGEPSSGGFADGVYLNEEDCP